MEPHLREVLDQARSARARASSFFALRTARLKLGVARGVSFAVLDDTLRQYVSAYPDTEIALHDDRPGDLREALRRGDMEVVLLPQLTHELDDLHYYPVGEDRLFAILPEAHALAALPEVPLEHAGRACRWSAATAARSGRRPSVRSREAGLTVTPKAIATRAEWLFELVSAGVGIGVSAHASRPAAGAGQQTGRRRGTHARDQPHHQARAALLAAGQGVRRSGAQAAVNGPGSRTGGLSKPFYDVHDIGR